MGDIIAGDLDALKELVARELDARFLPVNIAHGGDLPGGGPRFDPPEPGPGCDPRLAALWRDLFWGRPSGDAVAREHDADGQHGFLAASNAGVSGVGCARWERSPNWSGAVAMPSAGRRFSAIAARWRVPKATRPGQDPRPLQDLPPEPPIRGVAQAPGRPESWRCSIWVGLDGHRMASDSLPQIGTTVVVDIDAAGKERVRAHAWAQWWVRGKQYGEMRFEGFELAPDDTVTAWLGMRSPHEAVLRIRNERTRQIGSAAWRSGDPPAGARREADVRQVHADGAPAEGAAAAWVVERPMVMFSRELYPAPRFEPVRFERCIAALRDPGDDWSVASRLVDLGDARLIRMYHHRARPFRTEACVTPEAAREDRLTLRYAG
jgi:hypothetical protein